jgi:ketosteroid isomerase-like protein
VNEDGKIEMTVNYYDRESIGAQIQESFGLHRNGRVYDEHPFIDKVNQMVAHFEAGEIEELTSYFAADASFNRLSTMGETSLNLEERIETWNAAVAANSVRDLVQVGYPDAVYYERGDSWTVYSWWWVNNTNAETGEVTKKFLHLVHNFNNEGKVTSEGLYLQQ